MNPQGIGLNVDGDWLEGDLDRLATSLARLAEIGFDAAEIPPHGLDVIRYGELDLAQVSRIKGVVHRFPLRYTIHAPNTLNVANHPDLSLQRAIFEASLRFCAELEAGILVYHSGQIALERPALGLEGLPDELTLQSYWERETDILAELSVYAAELGVAIAIENRDPHLWEVATLVRNRRPTSDLPTYHAGMRLDLLAQQVKAIGVSNVGLTLDVGHAYLATAFCQTDFLASVATVVPQIRHVHWHDNYGRLDWTSEDQAYRFANGEGDLHMPPGWGTIPLQATAELLENYTGWLTMEIRPRYRAHYAQALADSRAALQKVAR
jgi:sugar phosphate isomerase/epimerase